MPVSRRSSFVLRLHALAASLLLAAAPARAQSNVGQISGTVTDAGGAVVPGCPVTVTSLQSGLKQTAHTDSSGVFIFPALAAGSYDVRAEMQGFRPSQTSGVVLDAASRRTVDFKLEVGSFTEAVSVEAATGQVETNSGDISRVISGTQVGEIALNGRNYAQLLQLAPGAVVTSTDPFNLGLSTTGQRINGIRSNSIYFMVDGADNMDNGGNSNAIINPSLDTIAEIKVLTSSYSAEFGGRSGALMNVVTKSGTREFRGSAYEFLRDDAFDSRSFFDRGRPAPLSFNNFGWTLGGPVVIPGGWNQDRSKLFFFAGQEWKYSHLGMTQVSTVPTAEERAGDFRNSRLAAPIDPLTGQPFPNRVIPANRFSRNGPGLLKPYPLPNFDGPGGNYVATGVNKTDTREDHLRLDYVISERTQVMARYTHDAVDIFDAFQGGNTGIVPGTRPRPGFTAILSVTHGFSPTLLNFASLSATKNRIQAGPENDVMSRAALGLSYPEIFPANRFGAGPDVTIAGYTAYNAGDFIKNRNLTFQFRDDLSKVAGSHALKFGVQLTRSGKDQNARPRDNGVVTFNTSARNSTGNVIADVLLGNFQNYTEGEVDQDWWARFNQYELYAQDSWRVSAKLTLELGLRYNVIEPLYSALGNFSTFDPARFDPARAPRVNAGDGSLVPGSGDPTNGIVIFGPSFPDAAHGRIPAAESAAAQALFAGLPRGGYETSYGDVGPRLGFAYDPWGRGKTAIRGGFGIFYDRIRTDYLGNTAANPPFIQSANVFDGNIDDPRGGTTRSFPPNLSAIRADMPTPKVISMNLGVQQELPGAVILHVNYVGTLGRNLTRTVNINQLPVGTRLNPPASTTNVNALRPYPGYGNISVMENADRSSYNALQVSAVRKMRQGLEFGINYAFSRTLDTSSGTPQDVYNVDADYGLSSIHRAHVLSVNYVYEIPFFRQHRNKALRGVLGGWSVSGVTVYQSGAPFSVTVPVDVARIGVTSSRATLVGDPNLPSSERTPAGGSTRRPSCPRRG
jgi:hypothetical protein